MQKIFSGLCLAAALVMAAPSNAQHRQAAFGDSAESCWATENIKVDSQETLPQVDCRVVHQGGRKFQINQGSFVWYVELDKPRAPKESGEAMITYWSSKDRRFQSFPVDWFFDSDGDIQLVLKKHRYSYFAFSLTPSMKTHISAVFTRSAPITRPSGGDLTDTPFEF